MQPINRVRPKLGDVIEIATPKGLAYAHYTHRHIVPPRYGALLRVLPGLFKDRPTSFSEMVLQAPAFITFFPLGAACNRKLVQIVANEPIPEHAKALPIFRNRHIQNRRGVGPWFLWDGKREWRASSLSEQQIREYPPLGTWNDTLLKERIADGWTHEKHFEKQER